MREAVSERAHDGRPPGRGKGEGNGAPFHTLIRNSHIFASAVRDILESKVLRRVTSLPLTLTQFHILKLMSLDGGHQVGEVAAFLGVSFPAATKNIDKLERLGLVVRGKSPGDRRATLLRLSPKSRRLVRRYEELKASRLEPLLSDFWPEEVDQLSALLNRFAVGLIRLEQPDHEFCLRCGAYIEAGCPVAHVRGGCPYLKARAKRRREEEVPNTA